MFLLTGSSFKPWPCSSRDNHKTIEQLQCSLRHRDIIYFRWSGWQSCHNFQGKGLGGTWGVLIKLCTVPHGAPNHPEQVQVMINNQEAAINPSGPGFTWRLLLLGVSSLAARPVAASQDPRQVGDHQDWVAGRENTTTTGLVRAGKANFHHPLAVLPSQFPRGCHPRCSELLHPSTSAWTRRCRLVLSPQRKVQPRNRAALQPNITFALNLIFSSNQEDPLSTPATFI